MSLRILNIMLGKGLGGIEQASFDYAEGLSAQGHYVVAVTHPKASINDKVDKSGLPSAKLANVGVWDPMSSGRMRRLARQFEPDVIIAHGNRAMTIAKKALSGKVPIVAVAHNYRFQQLEGCDAVFAITKHMVSEITKLGIKPDCIYHAPNMIRLPELKNDNAIIRNWHTPPLIGSIGRFVGCKGFDVFIEALSILKQREVPFQAVIGGNGEEEQSLHKLSFDLQLDDVLSFEGWVDDSYQFMSKLDIFCLPSLLESFGIVLLEAMAARLPIVSTDSEGPSEIITSGEHGVIVPKGKAMAMADALEDLLHNEVQAKIFAQSGYDLVRTHYRMNTRSEALSKNLHKIICHFKENYDDAE